VLAAGLLAVAGVLGLPPLLRRRPVALAAAVVLGLSLLRPPAVAGWPPRGWLVVACDVGQGDALAVAAGPGAAIVIDTGPDPVSVQRCLDRLAIRQVPLVVLSHHHADHVDGLPGVVAGRTVDAVLVSPLAEPADRAAAVRAWAAEADVPVLVAAPPGRAVVSGVEVEVLWPRRLVAEGSAPNQASVVLLVRVGGTSVLLTGDIEPAAQRALAARGITDVDVLKVPHHGSAAQDVGVLLAARAEVALVSAGVDNPYGHPDPGLLAVLARTGAVVGRTDEDGDLAVVPDADGRLLLLRRGATPS
jgi:competence protein ComEC